MTTPLDRAAHLNLVARLKSSYPELPDAPTPDLIDHERFTAYLKTPHDVGGEPDAPLEFENKQYEMWEENTYIMCELLGWRGIWLSEERRRMGNVDLGRAIYLGLPYYTRWLLAVARVLVEKHHIGLSELAERMAEVKARYEGGLQGKPLEARPKFEGDAAKVKRNRHHTHAVGKGDPQVYA
ncbi:MAG: nitrile hydratase subunit beta, partial [Mycobacterium sp.]